VADGGFNATLRDYARFGLVMASGGIGNGRKIVPCEWIADTLDCNADIFGAPYTDTLPDGAYRNQFWMRDHRKRVLMARGVFGQLIYISPADSTGGGQAVQLAGVPLCRAQHQRTCRHDALMP
jgi:CubicO group peptidase (beta-lactamase class C family)